MEERKPSFTNIPLSRLVDLVITTSASTVVGKWEDTLGCTWVLEDVNRRLDKVWTLLCTR